MFSKQEWSNIVKELVASDVITAYSKSDSKHQPLTDTHFSINVNGTTYIITPSVWGSTPHRVVYFSVIIDSKQHLLNFSYNEGLVQDLNAILTLDAAKELNDIVFKNISKELKTIIQK